MKVIPSTIIKFEKRIIYFSFKQQPAAQNFIVAAVSCRIPFQSNCVIQKKKNTNFMSINNHSCQDILLLNYRTSFFNTDDHDARPSEHRT